MDVLRQPLRDPPPAETVGAALSLLDEPDQAFARVAVELGFLTPAALERAVAARPQSPPPAPPAPPGRAGPTLGPSLLRQRLLSAFQLARIQQEIARRIVRCEACGAFANVAGREPGAVTRCPACAAALAVPLFLERDDVRGPFDSAGPPTPLARPAPSDPLADLHLPAAPTPGDTAAAPSGPDIPAGLGIGLPNAPATLAASSGASPTRGVPTGLDASSPGAPGSAHRLFGRYEILEVLGRGGMGVVYKARQLDLRRLVALKVMRDGSCADEKSRHRFHREAEAVARLRHPNLVAIFDAGAQDDVAYLTMELVEGRSLETVLQESPPDERQAVAWIEASARAVHYAHTRMVVHRDLKPGNILIDVSGQPRILDFGLAKTLDSTSAVTQAGEVLGTPFYMAPEQVEGETDLIGARTDVWALGAIFYQLLTGSLPFPGATASEVYHRVLNKDPQEPRKLRPAISIEAQTVCLQALEKDPERRYASAELLAEDLARILRGEPILARPLTSVDKGVRFVRKHRRAALVVSCFAVAGLVTAGGLLLRLRDERARHERLRAADLLCEKAGLLRGRAAESCLTDALAIEPEHAEALRLRGWQFLKGARWGPALLDLLKAERLDPRPGSVQLGLGLVAWWGLANAQEACARLRRAAAAEPATTTGLAARGLDELLRDAPEAARAAFEAALALDPRHALCQYGLGRVLLARRDAEGALAAFQRAADLEPDQGLFALGVAEAELALCRYHEVRAASARALELAPSLPLALLLPARADAVEKKTPDALDGLGRFLRLCRIVRDELGPALDAAGCAALLRPEPGIADALVLRGRLRLEADAAAARRDFEDALALDPRLPAAAIGLGQLDLAAGRVEEASRRFTLALEAKADPAEALGWRAEARRRGAPEAANTPADARADYLAAARAGLDAERSVAYPFYAAGLALLNKLRWSPEALAGKESIDAAAAPFVRARFENPRFAHAELGLAELLVQVIAPREAQKRLQAALALNPFLAEAYVLEGVLRRDFRETRELGAAGAALDRALELAPESAEARLERARLRALEKGWEAAVRDLDWLLARTPDAAAARKLRADCRARLNDEAGAEADLREWLNARPDPARAHAQYCLADHLAGSDRLDEANRAYGRAIEHDPRYADAYESRGMCQLRLGKPGAAFHDYVRGLELQPDRDAPIFSYAYRNRTYVQYGLSQSQREVDENLKRNPNDSCAHLLVGFYQLLLDRPAEARPGLDRAIDINPRFASAYSFRALSRLRTGDPDGAAADLDRARALAPNTSLLPLVEACLRASRGEPDAAFAALAIAVDRGKFGDEVLRQIKELRPLREDPRWTKVVGGT
ncbi:MAG: protein kinase [Planctomycetes bacterium]|nr:protein kinase [Planctomycetota bacterium]